MIGVPAPLTFIATCPHDAAMHSHDQHPPLIAPVIASPTLLFLATMNQPTSAQRPTRTDGEHTRARILDAAGRLIARNGFAKTTSKAIAAEAGADLASINYHFGGREGLYQAVMVEAHRRIVDLGDLQQLVQQPISAPEKLRQIITWLVRTTTQPPDPQNWQITVLSNEFLNPSSGFPGLLAQVIPEKAAQVLRVLSDITHIPLDDPRLLPCVVSVVAPCFVLALSHRNFPGPIKQVSQMPTDALVEHLYRFSMAGLQGVSEPRE